MTQEDGHWTLAGYHEGKPDTEAVRPHLPETWPNVRGAPGRPAGAPRAPVAVVLLPHI